MKSNRTICRNAQRHLCYSPPCSVYRFSHSSLSLSQYIYSLLTYTNVGRYFIHFPSQNHRALMENDFQFQQTLPVAGEASAASVDEAYFSGVYAGLSFRSLLAGDYFKPVAETRNQLKSPKTEPLFSTNDGAAVATPLYDFFSETASYSLHHQLPSLLSYEQPQNAAAAVNPLVPNPKFEADPYGKRPPPRPRQRQPFKLSEKTYKLRKLLPGDDQKMDMATVLEEAYKYIKFLQAQVSVLQSMPYRSAAEAGGNGVGGYLTDLNRQQLLQVVTNSPAVQAQLSAEGCCVYAEEQLLMAAERKTPIDEEVMYDSYNPDLFLN